MDEVTQYSKKSCETKSIVHKEQDKGSDHNIKPNYCIYQYLSASIL